MHTRRVTTESRTQAALLPWLNPAILIAAVQPARAQSYDFRDIGLTNVSGVSVLKTNSTGMTIGTAFPLSGCRGFVYNPASGSVTQLSLGGNDSDPKDINASGSVVIAVAKLSFGI